jgi:hypothetical protein
MTGESTATRKGKIAHNLSTGNLHQKRDLIIIPGGPDRKLIFAVAEKILLKLSPLLHTLGS